MTQYRIPGLIVTDHEFRVPLDYGSPTGEQISVFARALVAPRKAHADLPWLVFFQGGPGGKGPRPEGSSGWIRRALEEYRVLLLDQRGTGRSTLLNHQTLRRRGGPEAQAPYLAHFRADAIVQDAEMIRREMLGPDQPWSILGQSYGGFCVLHYLSFAPEGVREAMITGGLPPIERGADEVYRHTYRRVLEQNRRFFARYPMDQERARAIVEHIQVNPTRLPNGDPLTPHRFQTLGHLLGMSDGFERLHYLLDEAFVEGVDGPELSDTFLYAAMTALSFADHPLYAILHEAIYAQGERTGWSAERVRAEYREFALEPGGPVRFTGEMIFPWMFDEDSALRPLKEAAEILACRSDWPRLYDAERLRANTVPCAAVIYDEDMYVERVFSEETARTIRGCRVWTTNEFQHNGLRSDGEVVLGRLIEMLRGER